VQEVLHCISQQSHYTLMLELEEDGNNARLIGTSVQ